MKIPGIEPNDEHLRKQELKVRALEQMLEKMKAGEFEEEPVLSEPEQPELPVMKNDKERKEWLAAYQDWGIWYRDENIGATYYKYDFENGARLIVEEYENILSICGKEKKNYQWVLPSGRRTGTARSNRVEKWTRHERYTKYPNSENRTSGVFERGAAEMTKREVIEDLIKNTSGPVTIKYLARLSRSRKLRLIAL